MISWKLTTNFDNFADVAGTAHRAVDLSVTKKLETWFLFFLILFFVKPLASQLINTFLTEIDSLCVNIGSENAH